MKKLIFFSLLGILLYACHSPKQDENKEDVIGQTHLFRVDSTGFDLPLIPVKTSSPLAGADNFRTPSMPQIAPGRIYRSDALHELTEDDIAYLDSLGIRSIVDLRNADELLTEPDKVIPSVVNLYHFPITRDKKRDDTLHDSSYKKVRTLFLEGKFNEVEYLMDSLGLSFNGERKARYASFALNHRGSYGKFLKALADSSNFPLIFHCQGGKDRAGFASALLGKTLGATDREIMQDYLTTNAYGYEKLLKMKGLSPSIKAIVGAHADQLSASFEAIEAEYGSFENYLKEGLDLSDEDISLIRRNLLLKNNM